MTKYEVMQVLFILNLIVVIVLCVSVINYREDLRRLDVQIITIEGQVRELTNLDARVEIEVLSAQPLEVRLDEEPTSTDRTAKKSIGK